MTGLDPRATPPTSFDPWNFRPDVAVELGGARLAGHKAEAIDGTVGKVVEASYTPGDSYLLVSTGRLFGHQTLLPAGTVNHVDSTERKIYLDRSRDQVKEAPEAGPDAHDDPAHRETLAAYYRGTYS